jgi:glutamine synthetase
MREKEFIGLLFSDLNGTLKEVLISKRKFEESREKGIWFDGSSVQGLVRRFESDMRLKADTSSSYKFNNIKIYFCDIYQAGKPFEGDPRVILKNVLKELSSFGLEAFVAGELEFYLLKNGEPLDKASYFDVSPRDKAYEIKVKIVDALTEAGIEWESGHHEVGPGQNEIDIKYDSPIRTADKILLTKNIIKKIAENNEMKATFMPKPFFGLPGNGMHLHISLWKNGENLFYDEKDPYQLSKLARHFMGGIFQYIKEITCILNPTVNSYKRLGEFEAPKYIYWGRKNRDALIRIPEIVHPSSSRIELRSPDPSVNPYLAFAVVLKAGLEGIKNEIDVGEPIEEDIYSTGKYKDLNSLPSNLKEAVDFLKRSELAKQTLGPAYKKFIELKEKEVEDYMQREITDWEYKRYFDI